MESNRVVIFPRSAAPELYMQVLQPLLERICMVRQSHLITITVERLGYFTTAVRIRRGSASLSLLFNDIL